MAMPDNANKAFRMAYDKLNEHFPPKNTDEYRYMIADDFYALTNMFKDNKLLRWLLLGVQSYLDEYAKLKAIEEYESKIKEHTT